MHCGVCKAVVTALLLGYDVRVMKYWLL